MSRRGRWTLVSAATALLLLDLPATGLGLIGALALVRPADLHVE